LRKLNEPEVRKQYQIEITNRFAALENSDDDEDVNRTWENIKENLQTSAKESLGLDEFKQNKPWFDEECLGYRTCSMSEYHIHSVEASGFATSPLFIDLNNEFFTFHSVPRDIIVTI